MQAYAGIDVAFAKRKRLPVCLCVIGDGRLVPLPLAARSTPEPPRGYGNVASIDPSVVRLFGDQTKNYLHNLEDHFGVSIVRIGIDAPSSPRREDLKRREAELALDRVGIPCFGTPSGSDFAGIVASVRGHLLAGGKESALPHANKLWMLAGFSLFDALNREWECLEVYPQATMRGLGAATIHKSKAGAVAAQIRAVADYTGWATPLRRDPIHELKAVVRAPAHDALDAYASAWVASLPSHQRQAFGNPPSDAIWVPNLSTLKRFSDGASHS